MREQDNTCEHCANGKVTCWECDGDGVFTWIGMERVCEMCLGLGWWVCEDCDEQDVEP